MHIPGTVPRHVDSIAWQDYRGAEKGMVVYYNTDPVSEVPIREVPEDYPTDVVAEPNYETGTYGLYGCLRPKIRGSFFKSKLRYIFFMTKYAGTNVEYMDQLAITGYYRISKSADVQKLHVRYLTEYGCLSDETCMAFRADEVRMVSLLEAFFITPEVLDEWGYGSRVTRQTRIVLDEESTAKLLEYLRSKRDATAEYIEETKRLSPSVGEDEGEEEEEELAPAAELEGEDSEATGGETEEESGAEAPGKLEEVAEETEPAREASGGSIGPAGQAALEEAGPLQAESTDHGESALSATEPVGEKPSVPEIAAGDTASQETVTAEVWPQAEESGGEMLAGQEENDVAVEPAASSDHAPAAHDAGQEAAPGTEVPVSSPSEPGLDAGGGDDKQQ